MIGRLDDAASIELRNLDGINLEGESDKEDGKRPAVKEIIKARQNAKHRWNTFFIVICSFAVFIDPLLCYFNTTEVDHMCIWLDMKLVWSYIGLRIAIDVLYGIDIIIFLCGLRKRRKGKKFGACWKPRTDHQKSTTLPLKKVIKIRYFPYLLPSILAALPIPEALLLFSMWLYWDPSYFVFTIKALQYVLRIILIYGSKRWRSIRKTTTGRWLKPLLDSLPFIFASHLFGALWYYLATLRLMDCWKPHCKTILGYECKTTYDFVCDYDEMVDSTLSQKWCPTKNEDKQVFDFGIYLYAFQSKTTSSFNLPRRLSQSFWWALRNLSSFGSNLQTSMNALEIFFSAIISISGMALFLVYLNARMQLPLLTNLNDKMLRVICEHLKPVIYTEDNYIVQEGKPLGMMLFITQGIAWAYTTSKIDGAETSIKWLKRGDSYGEELLNWAFKCPSFSHLPISTRTVLSQEKVEAFALRASDLKNIVSKFWWHFTRELHQAELNQWENLAASSIQAAWRSRVARPRGSNLWDIFTVE